MPSRQLIYTDEKSDKFWNIECEGTSQTVTYGRSGTDGQTKAKDFDSEAAALSSYEKLIQEKLKKGYVDASADDDAGEAGSSSSLPLNAFIGVNQKEEIFDNAKEFIGLKVADFEPDKKIDTSGKTVYRFRSNWDEDNFESHLKQFLDGKASHAARAIVFGHWGGDNCEKSPVSYLEILTAAKVSLPNLQALYIGDIVQEENEISWINQADLSPLLRAFPGLQLLRSRGGMGLQLTEPKHANLRALIMETGGMDVEVVRSVCQAELPELEHLELWLGTEEYGRNCLVEDLKPIFTGKLFPKLKYLGLRNCDFVDDIANVIVNMPVVKLIETLDLSLGSLRDSGAKSLLNLPANSLKKLVLHHHYCSIEMMEQLQQLPFEVDVSGQERPDDEWFFVAVGE